MNVSEIRKLVPCYEPTTMVPEEWEGTPLDVMLYPSPDGEPRWEDRIWLLSHTQFVDMPILKALAEWCISELKAMNYADAPRLEAWMARGDDANMGYVASRALAQALGGDWKPAADKFIELLRGAP